MAKVGAGRLGHWIVIDVNDLVQIVRDDFSNTVEGLEVKEGRSLRERGQILGSLRLIALALLVCSHDKRRQGNRSQVANSHFIMVRVLDDFRAEVRALDSAQV